MPRIILYKIGSTRKIAKKKNKLKAFEFCMVLLNFQNKKMGNSNGKNTQNTFNPNFPHKFDKDTVYLALCLR
jgi:hypothetical protein